MAKVHDRILELSLTRSVGFVQVTAIKYFRDRGHVEDAVGYNVTFTGTSAQADPAEVVLDQVLPPATIIRMRLTSF